MSHGDDFVKELVIRPDIIPYVSLELQVTESLENIQERHVRMIGELTNYYHFELLGKPIKLGNLTPNLSSLSGMHRRVYHLLKWIELKIYKLRLKRRARMINILATLIDYLKVCPPAEDKMCVVVKRERLFQDLKKDPSQVSALRSLFDYKVQLVGNITAALKNEEMVRTELRQTIENVARSVDEKTSFFRIHPRQVEFERLFMSKMLPFGESFNELVEFFPPPDPQLFLQNLFALVIECLNSLGINRRPNDAALVLLLVRFIFDRLYETNEYYQSDGDDILGALSAVTVGYLAPPDGFHPPYELDARVVDCFRGDAMFIKAIDILEEVTFHTNPFDILDCVERCLTQVESSASYYDGGKTYVFPFEVTFGLFMAVVISSQIRNWVNISKFVEAYTPITGLCPAFEFSRTKIVACLMQFESMREDLRESGNQFDRN